MPKRSSPQKEREDVKGESSDDMAGGPPKKVQNRNKIVKFLIKGFGVNHTIDTYLSNISKEPGSLLYKIATGEEKRERDDHNRIILYCDPILFGYIIDYLRGQNTYAGCDTKNLENLRELSKNYGINSLVDEIGLFLKSIPPPPSKVSKKSLPVENPPYEGPDNSQTLIQPFL